MSSFNKVAKLAKKIAFWFFYFHLMVKQRVKKQPLNSGGSAPRTPLNVIKLNYTFYFKAVPLSFLLSSLFSPFPLSFSPSSFLLFWSAQIVTFRPEITLSQGLILARPHYFTKNDIYFWCSSLHPANSNQSQQASFYLAIR